MELHPLPLGHKAIILVIKSVSGLVVLEAPVPIQALKLWNLSWHSRYLNERPLEKPLALLAAVGISMLLRGRLTVPSWWMYVEFEDLLTICPMPVGRKKCHQHGPTT